MTIIYDSKADQERILADISRLRKQLDHQPQVRLIGFDQSDDLLAVQARSILKLHRDFFQKCGIDTDCVELPADATQKMLLQAIGEGNEDASIQGVTVLLPGPSDIDMTAAISAIAPDKEIEGLRWDNISRYLPGAPCHPRLPLIVIEVVKTVLARAPQPIPADAQWVVVADRDAMRTNLITGILAHLGPGQIWPRDAKISFIPSDSPDMQETCRQADVLLLAVQDFPESITFEYVKPGAVVLDFTASVVGIESTAQGSARPVYRGGVSSAGIAEVASLYCPAPRGCGPLLVASLARNALLAASNESTGHGQ